MKRLLLLVTLACTTTFAAEQTLVVPSLSKPSEKPAEDDPLRARYDAAWSRFEDAIAKVTADVTNALESQFEKAADTGNLELADMWDKKKKFFRDTKTLEWPSDGKAKVEWRKKNPKADFPEEVSDVVAAAEKDYAAAVDALKVDYEELVKEYTKARNLERAKEVREEMAALSQKPAASPQRPRMVEDEKPAFPRTARQLQQFLSGTLWRNKNDYSFEWDAKGNLWHGKDAERNAVKVNYTSGNKCTIEFSNGVKQTLVFNDDFTTFEQATLDGGLRNSAVRIR